MILPGILLLLLLLVASGGVFLWLKYPTLSLYSAYKAKWICSEVFVAGRSWESVRESDFNDGPFTALHGFSTTIDEDNRTVSVSYYGLAKRTAVFQPGFGATLAIGVPESELRVNTAPLTPPFPPDQHLPWPEGDSPDLPLPPPGVDAEKLEAVVAGAFPDSDPLHTRAVIVVYDGRIVSERYAEGFTSRSPMGGWSMTKSVTNALIGVAVHKGILDLEAASLFEEWRGPDDERSAIRIVDLLRMSSGLDFDEIYFDPKEEASFMLFRTGDVGAFAASRPLRDPPGTTFHYSSGDTNLLCRALRERIGNDAVYHAFPWQELFCSIGAHSAILGRDAAGTFIGSSFLHATARDWVRFGILYANDGVWNGERILPANWVDDFARANPPAGKTDPPHESGRYATHFHLRAPASDEGLKQPSPLPPGAFHMTGFQDQYLTIIPERKLVVVRLGLTVLGAWDHEALVEKILGAIP